METPVFKVMDRTCWSREPLFRYFTEEAPCELCLTVRADVSSFLGAVKARGISFYAAMLWASAKILNAHEEFRFRLCPDGRLLLYDFLSPSYALFHPEEEAFTRLVTRYEDSLPAFFENFRADGEKYRSFRGIVPHMPENHFDASCLPWVSYTQFDLRRTGKAPDLTPVVVWGKYVREREKVLLPVTLQIHHAVADGFHLSRFFTELQQLFDSFGGDASPKTPSR